MREVLVMFRGALGVCEAGCTRGVLEVYEGNII